MFSLKEREIIKRSIAISICNYRIEKLGMTGDAGEVAIFQAKMRKEMASLIELIQGREKDLAMDELREALIRGNDSFLKRAYYKIFGGARR